MNSYKVEYSTHDKETHVHHVSSTSRELAVYAAFDAVADLGHQIKSFKRVWMLDADTEVWHVITKHKRTTASA